MAAHTTRNSTVVSSSLAGVAFDFFWQARLVHMPMNKASRRLSVHSKRPHLSEALSCFHNSRWEYGSCGDSFGNPVTDLLALSSPYCSHNLKSTGSTALPVGGSSRK